MGNTIFADPFGQLLLGVRAGRQDNLNEARLAADVQAQQDALRQQALDRALRVELAQFEQQFAAAQQQSLFAQQRALQRDNNEFTFGIEAQRELNALQRERRQQDFDLQRNAQQNEFTLDRDRTQAEIAATAAREARNFEAGENRLTRGQQATLAQQANDLRVRLADIEAARAGASDELRVRLAAEDAQLRRDLADIEARRDRDLAATPRPATPVDPLEVTADVTGRAVSTGLVVPRLNPDGSVARDASGLPLLEAAPAGAPSLAAFDRPAPTTLAEADAVATGATGATRSPPELSSIGSGFPPAAPTQAGQALDSPAAVAGSVETRLRGGLSLPNAPGIRGEVADILARPPANGSVYSAAERRIRNRAQAWLRANR